MSLREHRLLFRVLPVPASVRPDRHKARHYPTVIFQLSTYSAMKIIMLSE